MEVKEVGSTYMAASSERVDPALLRSKQTEIGPIPEDWEVKEVHEFAGIMTGPFGTLLKSSEYSEGDGVPLISVGEVRDGVLRITGETPRVSVGVTKRLPQYVLKKGDVVFGRKGGVERSALIRREQEGWFLGSDGIRVRPTQDLAEEYLAFQFRSARVRSWLLQHAIGTTMPSLNQQILQKVAIALPPTKAEQVAIADALSDADALIESLEQLIAKKRQIKQGTMQALLTGEQRLPGFTESWQMRKIGDLLSIMHGKSQHAVEEENGIYPILATGGQIGFANRFLYDKPSVLIGRKGTIDRPQYMDTPFWSVDTLFYSVVHEPNVAKYLFYRFCLIDWRQHNEASGVPSLNARTIEQIEIEVPKHDEQRAIATILSDMDTELTELETRLAKTRQLKQGMMQELLTGRIRLVPPAMPGASSC